MTSSRRILIGGALALLLFGCAAPAPPLFDPKDAEGPPADFSGEWFLKGKWLFSVQQAGQEAECLYPAVASRKGTVKGRVLELGLYALTLDVDGRSAVERGSNGKTQRWDHRTEREIIVDGEKAGEAIRAHHPLIADGEFYKLPVGSDGKLNFFRLDEASLAIAMAATGSPEHRSSLKEGAARDIAACSDSKFRAVAALRIHVPQGTPLNGVALNAPGNALEVQYVFWPLENPSTPVVLSEAMLIHGSDVPRCVAKHLAKVSRRQIHPRHQLKGESDEFWFVLSPSVTPAGLRGAWVEVYRKDPSSGALPVEVMEIAQRQPDGVWASVRAYLRTSGSLVQVEALMESGQPAGVKATEIKDPPLEDFLVVKEARVDTALWRNRILLLAKNRSLPGLLTTSKAPDLKALVERIEQVILDVNREMEGCNDEAQRLLAAKQDDDAKSKRDLALAYKERIEILKPILAAIKDEVSNRDK